MSAAVPGRERHRAEVVGGHGGVGIAAGASTVPSWPALALLAAVVALSRLPFLGAGYGSDMDAWSVAYAARWIAEHGRYGASRFPGHPVQELTCALLWRGGPWALNGATAAMSVAAAVAFARLLGMLRVRDAWLGALALAFIPAVFIHSTDAMDFVWAIPFLIASLSAALQGRAVVAGLMLGVAVGCRITSAAMLPTVALLLAARAGSPGAVGRTLAVLVLASVAAAGVALAPMIARFGFSFLTFYESPYPAGTIDVLKNATIEVWGLVGSLGLIVAGGRALLSRRRPPPAFPRPELMAWLLALGLFGAAFLRLPFDAGYLLPAVPLVLVLAARLLDRRAFVGLCASLIVAPLVLEVAEIGRPDSPVPSGLAATIRIRGRPVAIDLLQGPVRWDQARRRAQIRHTDRIRAAADAVGGDVMVIADGWTSWLQVDHRAPTAPGARFTHAINAARAAELRGRGVRLFYVPEAQWDHEARHGVGLESLGAEPLPGIAARHVDGE